LTCGGKRCSLQAVLRPACGSRSCVGREGLLGTKETGLVSAEERSVMTVRRLGRSRIGSPGCHVNRAEAGGNKETPAERVA
jgi:hypothetical protein